MIYIAPESKKWTTAREPIRGGSNSSTFGY